VLWNRFYEARLAARIAKVTTDDMDGLADIVPFDNGARPDCCQKLVVRNELASVAHQMNERSECLFRQ
jgi:hypothetical protein